MSDLMSKLTMRRKGISGDKSASPGSAPDSGSGGAMDKISSMIPPPPAAGDDDSAEEDNDDDWE